MLSFTLDTNCIIDVAEKRADADDVMKLAEAHASKRAHVAVSAVSASERQQGDYYLDSFKTFVARLDSLGLGHLAIIKGIGYFDVSYNDFALWADEKMTARERAIHDVLFPKLPFSWPDYANSVGIDVSALADPKSKKWRNAFCDRQMYWAHDHAKHDFFVTRDQNFTALMGDTNFPNAIVFTPAEAVKHL